MHFLTFALSLVLLAGSALAQGIYVSYPPAGSTLTAGSDTTVQLTLYDGITSVDIVSIVLGLAECPSGVCYPPSETMGTVLYQGPFTYTDFLYDNLTVTIPEGFTPGEGLLTVLELALIGDVEAPLLYFANQSVTVAA